MHTVLLSVHSRLSVAALLVSVALAVTACGPAATTPDADVPSDSGTVVTGTPEMTVTTVYVEGLADRSAPGAEWQSLEIGDTLEVRDRVRTGPGGYAEIQLGNLALIRVQQNTQIDLSRLAVGSSGERALVQVSQGALASRVQQLAGGSAYAVGTPSAVAGVRGTEFVVVVETDGSTRVSVGSGTVAIVPALPDRSTTAEAIALATPLDLPQEALLLWQSILDSATRAGAGEEIRIEAADAASETATLIDLAAQIQAMERQTDLQSEQAQQQLEAMSRTAGVLRDLGRERSNSVQPAAPDVLQLLERPAVPSPVESPVPSPGASAPIEPQPAPEAPAAAPLPRDAIAMRLTTDGLPLVRAISVAGDTMVAADERGTLWAFSADGRRLWRVATQNGNNENSRPVVGQGTAILSGERELVAVDLATGRVRHRRELDESSSHLFGNRVAILGAVTLVPVRGGVVAIDTLSGAEVRRFTVPAEVLSSPGRWEETVLIANSAGELFSLNVETGETGRLATTGLRQPVSVAPAFKNGTAYLADRRGLVVAIDPESGATRFGRLLREDGQAMVVTDPVAGDQGLYLFARGSLYALDRVSGEPLFTPRDQVSAPPALIGSSLYFGTTDNLLVEADPVTGRVLARLPLPARATTRPAVLMNGRIAVGLANGEIAIVDRSGTGWRDGSGE